MLMWEAALSNLAITIIGIFVIWSVRLPTRQDRIRRVQTSHQRLHPTAPSDLLRYEGISNIRDPNGERYDARIDFPPADRKITALNPELHAK